MTVKATAPASADPAAMPLIDPNYWADPHDRQMSIKGLRMARDIMGQAGLAAFVEREVLPGPGIATDDELANFAHAHAKTDHHPVGTAKMGVDEMAVVSPELKVHGIEALRVCDASVMPQIPSSNTNAPTIMIGEKGADLIRGLEPLEPAVFDGNDLHSGGPESAPLVRPRTARGGAI